MSDDEVDITIIDLRAQAVRECFFDQQRTVMLAAADLIERLTTSLAAASAWRVELANWRAEAEGVIIQLTKDASAIYDRALAAEQKLNEAGRERDVARNDLRAIKTLTTQLEADIHSAHHQRYAAEQKLQTVREEVDGLRLTLAAAAQHLRLNDPLSIPNALRLIEDRVKP